MVINGDDGDNVLNGDNDDDVINGGNGNDTLNGNGGNDTLVGDRGSDTNNGGDGHDLIIWNNGDGSDLNDGGDGIDTQQVNGGNGDENFTLQAGGQDFLFDRVSAVAFTLNDQNIEKLELNANDGNDSFVVSSLADTNLNEASFYGGEGDDLLDASATEVKITASGGGDDDTLLGGSANDILNGDDGNDVLVGNKGDDWHNGGNGNDIIVWNNGDGSDNNDGGWDYDTQVVNGANGAGDEFVVRSGGNDFLFDRVNLGPFTLNDTGIENLLVNGGGDDKMTVADLYDTDLRHITFNGGNGSDILEA